MGSGEVVAAIDALPSVDELDDYGSIHELIDSYFALPDAAEHLDVWFRLYERFPETDANYAFWSILHRIEAQRCYEQYVVTSVHRKPSYFPVMMVNRMLNGGVTSVATVDLLDMLQAVASDPRCLISVRKAAEGYLEHQRSCG